MSDVRARVPRGKVYLGVAGFLLGLGIGGCRAPAQPASARADSVPAAAVPGVGGGPEDHIDAIDLAVGPGDTLHVVWREVDRDAGGGLPRYRTMYARGERGGASWSSPEVLRQAAGGPPRIFRGPGGIHVLAGRRLVHLRRDDAGSWHELGRIVPAGSSVAEGSVPGFAYFGGAVDAAALGDELAVAFLVRRGAAGPLGLDLVRWRSGGAAAPRRLAEFPAAAPQQAAPRLRIEAERAHLLWAVGEEVRETVDQGTGPVETYSTRARLFYLGSGDRGASWQPPVEVTASLAAPPRTIDDVELLVTDTGLYALYSSHGLYLSRSEDGRDWSRPRRIAGYRESPGSTSTGAWSLTAAGPAVAWIDERFQESGRRWWKPLGGWPWSDSPEGVSSDVFVLPASVLRGADGGNEVVPRRQTPERSWAFLVRLGASRERLFLLWTGRRQVGKTLAEDPVPPEIFYRLLTPDLSGM